MSSAEAVFFDWFGTLAHYNPPREELHSQALQEFGIQVSPAELLPAILAADEYFLDENAKSPVARGDPVRRAEVYGRYQQLMLTKVGVTADRELLAGIMRRMAELFQGMGWALYKDVLPVLKTLKQQDLTLGLLTNMVKDMAPVCRNLGLDPYLDFVVTSEEAGADKPHPLIFETALRRAGVDAAAAVHVGDQYRIDVIGASGVGIRPVFLDRYDQYPEVSDCPRIRSLTELAAHI